MYPIQCKGGNYAVPVLAGKFQIRGVLVTAQSTDTACRIVGVDDDTLTKSDKFGRLLSSTQRDEANNPIFDLKGIADVNGTLGVMFPAPIKVIHGLSIYVENVEPGKNFVYRD